MARYRFTQAYEVRQNFFDGSIGPLIHAFSIGDIVDGTFRVQQLTQLGMPNVNWVDVVVSGQTRSIPANILTQVSASNPIPTHGDIQNSISNIPAPVKGLLGLGAIFIFLKVVKVI